MCRPESGPLLLQHIMSGEPYENPIEIQDDDPTSMVRRARSRGVGLLLVKTMVPVPILCGKISGSNQSPLSWLCIGRKYE